MTISGIECELLPPSFLYIKICFRGRSFHSASTIRRGSLCSAARVTKSLSTKYIRNVQSLRGRKAAEVKTKSPSILAELNNPLVWMVPTCRLIFNPSCPFSNLEIVPSTPITNGITVTFMFPSLFGFFFFCLFFVCFFFVLWKCISTSLSFCFLSVLLCSLPVWQS